MSTSMTIPPVQEKRMWQYETFLFDADGVLWRSNEIIPGAVNFVNRLQELGKQVFIITNNSTKTTAQYLKKLHDLGFALMKEGVYLIASGAVKQMLEEGAGAECFGTGPDPMPEDVMFPSTIDVSRPASAVVVGYDGHFSYIKLMKAANYIKNPKTAFFITNEDYTFPMPNEDLLVPGTGCITASVRAAVLPRQPLVFGKPSQQLAEYLRENYRIDATTTIMFGDRLDTDIKFGNECGFDTCWMTTGVHSIADIERAANEAKDPALVPKFTYSFHVHA